MKLLLLALVPACFALNPVTGRALVEDFGPATLSLVRWSLSGLVIAAIALMRPGRERWRAPPSHLLRLTVLGALAMGFGDLMSRTADEIVTVFFDHVEKEVLRRHADWEINGVMKNRDRGVVTAIGSLIPAKNDPPLPFLLMISAEA